VKPADPAPATLRTLADRDGWLFDLDGTLIDSSAGVVRAFHAAQRALGEPPADPAQIRRRIGYPLIDTVAALSRAPGEAFLAVFRSEALASMHLHSHLLPGAGELVNWLGERGRVLGIVTSKRRDIAVRILAHLGILGSFRTVVGADCVSEVKPRPAPLWEAARRLDLDASRLIMVGDTQNDVQAALAAGLPVIALTSGVDDRLLLAGAHLILDDARTLLGQLKTCGPPAVPARLLLYSRHDCPLCDELKDRLRAQRLRFEERDILGSDVWYELHRERIPVVVAGGREYAAPISDALLEAWTALYR
jgi:phosphoglycolate phosphatase-like HAD superfamily hydrolase